ncbi:WD40 repeat domain-containing protein [uncultured Methylobacterium sp.]|uniref:WD40 repeat domain-containing protein n=1 Tax=uncultured Methylobacterium sp. TaxID=157278 RepID=UPI0025971FFE|nr:WD40 repeat domain-containing protein [uncultured Methylobacterium sp.]
MNAMHLIDLLGRRWSLGAPVTQIAFDATEAAVGFALADGRLAIAPVADPESAIDRYHVAGDTGRATITPRRKGAPPLVVVATQEKPTQIAGFGTTGFLTGSNDGALAAVGPDGTTTHLARLGRTIHALAPIGNGRVLIAVGDGLMTAVPGDASPHPVLENNQVLAPFAVAPSGDWLAHRGAGLTLRRMTDERNAALVLDAFDPRELAWSPDGRWLAAALTTGGIALLRFENGQVCRTVRLPDYPAPVHTLGWDATSRLLTTSGAYRIVVWPVDQFDVDGAEPRSLPTGRAGLATVDAVSVHPRRALVAAAYENGMVVVAPFGDRNELVVRSPCGDPIAGMTWSGDGECLAFGTRAGEASIVTFPPQLFK